MKKYILLNGLILSLLLVGCGNKASISRNTINSETNNEHQSKLLVINNETPSIEESDVKDVIARTLWKVNNTTSYKVTSTGTSKASIANQTIDNLKIVKGSECFLQTTSTGLINFSKQRFLLKDQEKYLRREASKVSSTEVTYDDNLDPEVYSFSFYLDEYGILPYSATSYIINESTYLTNPTIVKEDNNYRISVELDPDLDKAPYYYVKEIITSSESTSIPEFKSIKLEFLIDNNYTLLSLTQDESYVVTKIIKATTVTHVLDTYSYENVEFNQDIYSYFSRFFNNDIII